MKRKRTFLQHDVTRAVRAAQKAGLEVARVEVDTCEGRIILTMVSQAGEQSQSALDRWREARRAH